MDLNFLSNNGNSKKKKKVAESSTAEIHTNGATPSGTVLAPNETFREGLRDQLNGATSGGGGGNNLFGSIGFSNDGESQQAMELFDVPTDFNDVHELRRLIVKSDIPAEQVPPLMFMLALAERFGSEVVPSLIGWLLLGRIGKNREGRKEFVQTARRPNIGMNDDEDN